MSRKCPCTPNCPDRNARCHMKGNCKHDFEGWAKEHEEERENWHKKKEAENARWTDAQVKRHIHFIKHGQGN